ncbi:ATP-binding cassette domain-containing protein [Pararobbsia silviterrae]|uniref:ATP-binding cassette domain-containing protein n=1 Tax=Pararobbsia silviterrae TaxID=1792498 RepID=A0A494X3N2_9BURK|nr:ATP-binding cassette domain-containing protein [Pararobbsia silviterrae]RKP44241.1 ATP-binding cassette domain-containing protein [Pararobbsia silviterrae]
MSSTASLIQSPFATVTGIDIEADLRADADRSPLFGDAARSSNAPLRFAPTSDGRTPAAGDRAGREVAVSLARVSKRYGTRTVLNDIDFQIERGSFVSIVGRSGCGKSTLLRLVAGLETIDDGVLDARRDDGVRLETRIMFQDARLLPWKTVLQNVMLGMPKQAREAARAVLADVGLADRADDWPAELSGGQRQRVALARALVHQPELLLLDEPLGALDALTRIEMHALIERLWRERGFTALLVTHDVHEAVALGDRVVLIERGQIALDQRVDLARPRARGSVAFAALEDAVLQRVLGSAGSDPVAA